MAIGRFKKGSEYYDIDTSGVYDSSKGQSQEAINQALSNGVDDLKSAFIEVKHLTSEEVSNNYIADGSHERTSVYTALTKRYYNYMQDGLLTVEVPEGYFFYAYAWKRPLLLGAITADGSIGTLGNAKLLNRLNLADYPYITFKFALRHLVNGSSVEVPLEDADKFKLTFNRNSKLSGRRISVIGDSISSFTGYTTPGSPNAYYPLDLARVYHVQNMYWKCLADRNGMTIDTIDAYAGSTVGDKWQDAVRVPFIDDTRINRLGTPDVIIVEGGINDFDGNPLGDYPALGDYSRTYEFRTAYSLLLNKLKTKYTSATIICLSMITPHGYNNTTFPEMQTEVKQTLASDKTPHTLAEFNESIERIAKQYQCAYCDITNISNYYSNPTSSLGPHWYFNIHLDVAYRIEQLLKEIYA